MIQQIDGLGAIVISDRDGVTITQQTGDKSKVTDEISLSATFSDLGDQANKLSFGKSESITTFFGDRVVVHVNDSPLFYSLIGTPDANVGVIHSIIPELKSSLANLRTAIASHD